ncbi:MAG: polysaccharide biosynthesis C-terminal domain-containing protein [Mogibacterium sp.]|nr:polysaccharide biosynthesis C-terminal domain-containing protein [Mogibacterium sp.]
MRKEYSRSDRLLRKKFFQYLLPTMVTYAALSLNEFVDSMLVSNLLDSDAMAIISLGMPLMLVMAAVYSLLGNGGAAIYALSLGRRDHDTAGKSLTAAIAGGLASGLALLVIGNVFFNPLSRMLCHDAELMPEFQIYFRVLLLSSPVLITMLTFASFLPAAGYPKHSTFINVVANIVNIAMDYVYIRVFGMGVEGAAWATLTGYTVGAVIVVVLLAGKKIRVRATRDIVRSMDLMGEIIKRGGPDALTQIGFSLQFAFINAVAGNLAGTAGILAFSLCIQMNSIVSIFVGSLIGSSVPFLSVLHGQRDFRGEEGVLKTALKGQFIIVILSIAVLGLLAPQVAALYNITGAAEAALAAWAMRIYLLTFIVRGGVIIYFRYLMVIGFSGYASLVSALDGFAAIIPVAWILSKTLGTDGLWFAFPITAVLIMIFIIIRNRMIEKKSDGRLKGILLLEHDEAEPVLDVTITNDASFISGISEVLQDVCEKSGIDSHEAMKAALAVEEMAVYAANKKDQNAYMDILARIYKGNVEIDFRSLGPFFDPFEEADEDIKENILLLRGIASKIENEYVLGMNSTRITIEAA